MEPNSAPPPSPKNLPDDSRKRDYELWSRITRIADRVVVSLLACALAAIFVWFVDVWLAHQDRRAEIGVERSRVDNERLRATTSNKPAPAPAPASASVVASKPADQVGLTVLLESVEHQPTGDTKGATVSGNIRTAPLISLVGSLVSLGQLSEKTAGELTKALIDGGKEITVDTAKALIHKYLLPDSEAKSTVLTTPPVQVNVTSGCCCTKPPTPRVDHPHPIPTPKPATCPKT